MIDTDLLGSVPRTESPNPLAIEAIEQLQYEIDDRELAVALARKALKLEPGYPEALLVVAESAPTRAERIALLKEVISVYKREVNAGRISDFQSCTSGMCTSVTEALMHLGYELAEVGDREGAKACLRLAIELDVDDKPGCQMALDELEGIKPRRRVWP